MTNITEIIPDDMPEWMKDAMDEGRLFRTVIDRFKAVLDVVNEQAEEEGLWFNAVYITEVYLQQELRRLHTAIEKGE